MNSINTDFTFENMLALAASKPELTAKEEVVDGITVTIFSYMVQMKETFDNPLALEFRGSVFRNDTGECICRPFKKFFNVGEHQEILPENLNLIDADYFTKHDGSMITPVIINDKIFWKTKKSFYSDVALKVTKFINNQMITETKLNEYKKYFKEITPIFEYVDPENRIVLNYDKEDILFLGYRNIKTGEYVPSFEFKQTVFYDDIFNMENIEGFVIHTVDGKMVKSKTKWYLDRHKICTEFNPKRIIAATIDETVDDIIGMIYQLGMPERAKSVEKIRDEVNTCKLDVISVINLLWEQYGSITDRKEFALRVCKKVASEYRGMLFKLFEGKEYDNILNKYVFEEMRIKYLNYVSEED